MDKVKKNIDYILLGLVLIIAVGSLVYHEVKEPSAPIYDEEGNVIGYAAGPCGGMGINMEIAKEIASGIKPGMTTGIDTSTTRDAGVARGAEAGVTRGVERDMAAGARESVVEIRNTRGNIVGFGPCQGAGIVGGGSTGILGGGSSEDEDDLGSGESGPGTGMVGGGDGFADASANDDDEWKKNCVGGETEQECKERLERKNKHRRRSGEDTGSETDAGGEDKIPSDGSSRNKFRRRSSGIMGCGGAISVDVKDYGPGLIGSFDGTTFEITYGDGTPGFTIECEEGEKPVCTQDSITPSLEHWGCE